MLYNSPDRRSLLIIVTKKKHCFCSHNSFRFVHIHSEKSTDRSQRSLAVRIRTATRTIFALFSPPFVLAPQSTEAIVKKLFIYCVYTNNVMLALAARH